MSVSVNIINWIRPLDATFVKVSEDSWFDTDALEGLLKDASITLHSFKPDDQPPWSLTEVRALIDDQAHKQFVVMSTEVEPFAVGLTTMAIEQGFDTYFVAPASELSTNANALRLRSTKAKVTSITQFTAECRYGLHVSPVS